MTHRQQHGSPFWRSAFIFLLSIPLAACEASDKVDALSESEIALFDEVGIDAESALTIRNHGQSVERLQGLDDDWNQFEADGIVLLTEPSQGELTLPRLRSTVDTTRYAIYLNDLSYGYGPDLIAVLANTDPWFYLETVRINGINYDIEHDDVIRRLKKWDELYGLKLVGAGMDWLHAEFERPPADWPSFAAEVYEFCPDVVDQGTGTVEALEAELKKLGGVYLWWD